MIASCSSCGTRVDQDAMRCPACAELVSCTLRLRGSVHSLVFRVETPVGRVLLQRLGVCGARPAAWEEFRLRRDEDGFWCIERGASASTMITLNGGGLGATVQRLHAHDRIGLQGADGVVRVEFERGAVS